MDLVEFELGSTQIEYSEIDGVKIPKYINDFWTSKQRQSSSLHELSYRACFKANLPHFFISLFTKAGDIVYDPFSGRGTTVIEAGLMGREILANDINPLSTILSKPRFFIPNIKEVEQRLLEIPIDCNAKAEIDLSMFYHRNTEAEIVSIKDYFNAKAKTTGLDSIDNWIKMVATNRLTGHSAGFFSVYTLPPNQAVSPERQIKINLKRGQVPEYKNTRGIIIKKTKTLLKKVTQEEIKTLYTVGSRGKFLNCDARETQEIESESVQLTVTSPPFLDVVQYSKDNWLRCWFNGIDSKEISKKITMSRTLAEWSQIMGDVFRELYRITRKGGWIAFEVGEVKKGTVKLEDYVVPLGMKAGFDCAGILINLQEFTKTANIWGVSNNKGGTNTNRIVLFQKN